MIKFLVAAWLVSGVTASVLLVWYVYRKSNPNTCDTCKHLKTKGGEGVWRYYCKKRFGGYDSAPEYCSDWEPQERGEG